VDLLKDSETSMAYIHVCWLLAHARERGRISHVARSLVLGVNCRQLQYMVFYWDYEDRFMPSTLLTVLGTRVRGT
jgi:hypothetical protein